ncbi:YueI family protein [Bacillus sp. REN16]|uniref:YueI family protein n=1 Tax=Bacillus sp. REN16 TaxID=2887296 RepID=UPI001E2C0932|nr:YueI family protein [Bacillus sp. REN16]MCC3358508.1 YueI family protein [Bacillus sp. REN16]
MANQNVDDYLQQGIHGAKEIKPEERKKFLGTIRERVEFVLTQSQVRENKVYQEIQDACKKNNEVHMYLNGHVDYRFLSKYVKLASANNIEYTIVTNKDSNSDLGLVLAFDHAIDKDEIYINEKIKPILTQQKKPEKKGFFSFFKKSKKK